MPFFSRFLKRWSATGVVAEPTDNQADTGFSYLGANPPTVELFNALFRNLDDKDNWIYTRLSEVMIAGGVTPSEATPNQLLTALRKLFQPNMQAFTEDQAFVVPAFVTKLKVRGWGGGGGGAGGATVSGTGYAGTGGSSGSYFEGVVAVTPGTSIFMTIGGLGAGGLPQSPGSAGGTTSFGTFMSAPGGGGGNYQFHSNTFQTQGYQSSGGDLSLFGGMGGLVMASPLNGNSIGGPGGSAPGGGGQGGVSSSGLASTGLFPGGGGGGAGGQGSFPGGSGAKGCIIVEY